jgi:glutathione S-transferase
MITFQYWDVSSRTTFAHCLAAAGNLDTKTNSDAANSWPTCEGGIGKDGCPFGQMPIMTVEGEDGVIGESEAIARYVATVGGLIPSDPWKAAISDMVWSRCFGTWNELTACAYADMMIAVKFHPLVKILGDKPFFTGDKVAACDVIFFATVQLILLSGCSEDPLRDFPTLAANLEATRTTGRLADLVLAPAFYKV